MAIKQGHRQDNITVAKNRKSWRNFLGISFDPPAKDEPKTRQSSKRPGSGPCIVMFSQIELEALAQFAVGYPLEEATPAQEKAFKSGIAKIKARLVKKQQMERIDTPISGKE